MEDSESEWAIQEYPSSKEGETTMVRWILNKGYGIGKKVVITGIALTSAPLVLPPLVVFSAMGVAFSVPFGLVFMSYACTNKLMSKLLPQPPPASPLLLEYYDDEDEDDEFTRENVILESEDGQTEDKNRELEVLISNADGIIDDQEGYDADNGGNNVAGRENVLPEEEDDQMGFDDYSQEVEALISNKDGLVGDESYDINGGEKEEESDEIGVEMVLQDEDERMEDINLGVEVEVNLDEAEALIPNANGVVDEKGYYTDEDEEEEGKQENALHEEREVIEDIKRGVEDESCEDDRQEAETLVINANGIGDEQVLREEEDEKMEDIKQGVAISSIANADENVVEVCHTSEDEAEKEREDEELKSENVKHEEVVNVSPEGDSSTANVQENVDGRENFIKEEEKKQMEDIKQRVERRLGFDMMDDDLRRSEESSISIFNGGVDEEGYEEDDDSLEEESKGVEPLIEMNLLVISVEESMKETQDEEDEIVRESTGLLKKIRDGMEVDNALENDRTSLVEGGSNGANDEVKQVEITEPVARNEQKIESEEKSLAESILSPENSNDDREKPILGMEKEGEDAVFGLVNDRNMSLEGHNEEVVTIVGSKTDTKVTSQERVLVEEKIWEQIGAMRAIVGYRAPSQATCMEELKALFEFTGVEPPPSIKGDSNLDEVNVKLKFLMSIVGVK